MGNTEHFVFCLVDDFTHIAFACAVEPLRIANLISGEELYSWSFASENGETATASNGAIILMHRGFEPLTRNDRLIVLSGINVRENITPGLLAFLRREKARGIRIGAICSGALVLAEAGFLNGMRAAIHWDFHDSFVEEYPDIDLSPSVFISDAPHITASGGTAAGDLMLKLIEDVHGYDLAVEVADQMVYNTVRSDDDAQCVSLQARHGIRIPHIAHAIELMMNNTESPMSPASIARELGISTRQLQRLFVRYLNTTPKKYATELRLQKARHLLLQTEKPITEISMACGFGTPSSFTRVFRSRYGVTPTHQRARFQ